MGTEGGMGEQWPEPHPARVATELDGMSYESVGVNE
jgi:hypothetical protein